MPRELPVDIRVLTPDDVAAYSALRQVAVADPQFGGHPQSEHAFPPELVQRTLIARAGSFYLGAFIEDAMVGMVGFGQNTESCTGTVFGLFVAESCRRRGIAKRLMSTLVGVASANVESIELFVATTNVAARALYRQLGFAEALEDQAAMRLVTRRIE